MGKAMFIEHISFNAMHGEHPLGSIIGTPLADARMREIVEQLRAGCSWGAKTDPRKLLELEDTRPAREQKQVAGADTKEVDLASEDLKTTDRDRIEGWSLPRDESLVALLQTMASRLGMPPNSFDAVMFNPSNADRSRFSNLVPVPVDAMRARVAVLKFLNRLLTPLLHYVDVRCVVMLVLRHEAQFPRALQCVRVGDQVQSGPEDHQRAQGAG